MKVKQQILALLFVAALLTLPLSVFAQSNDFVSFPPTLSDWPKYIVTGIFPVLGGQFPDAAFQGLNPIIYILVPLVIYAFLIWDFFNFVGFPTQPTTRKWLAALFTLASLPLGIIAVIVTWIYTAGLLGIVAIGGVGFIVTGLGRAFGWGKGKITKQEVKSAEQTISQLKGLENDSQKLAQAIDELDQRIDQLRHQMVPNGSVQEQQRDQMMELLEKKRNELQRQLDYITSSGKRM